MILWTVVILASFSATITLWLAVQCLASYVRTARDEQSRELWRDDDTVDYGGSETLVEETPYERVCRELDDDFGTDFKPRVRRDELDCD